MSEGAAHVLRTGRPALYADIPDSVLEAAARDPEHLRLLQELGLKSAMIVPLVAHDRTLGTMTFVTAESGRRYRAQDLALAEELAHRAGLALDNARLYRELQEQLEARDEFLSSVAHDLKNPLTNMKAQAQLLQRRAGHGTLEQGHILHGLANIDASATKMAGLVNELLDMARVQLGQPLELDRRRVDLLGLARRQVAEYQQATERHRIRLRAEAPRIVGRWDPERIERVLANLLSNAIKYSPHGGEVRVTVGKEPGPTGPWAVVAVRDAGLGIPAADLPRVFERFHRGGNVVGRIGGTGIGLAGARSIVERHGGTISVESQEGAGSAFTVRLPLEPE
jgi:signal transduction histidine kinase